jgi:hypothetical protein
MSGHGPPHCHLRVDHLHPGFVSLRPEKLHVSWYSLTKRQRFVRQGRPTDPEVEFCKPCGLLPKLAILR